MKKIYAAPMLIITGDVVDSTLSGNDMGKESAQQLTFRDDMVGSVGYYL